MIEVKHLTKKYASETAVNDISFTVEPGKIYGFLGPNGAGKSTTMNIITGCLAPTDGQVLINGYDITEEPEDAKRFIGYLPEIPPLYPDFTPLEYREFYKTLFEDLKIPKQGLVVQSLFSPLTGPKNKKYELLQRDEKTVVTEAEEILRRYSNT